jgi:hypothetical protein
MMMKTSPGTAFDTIPSHVIFGALEGLFDVPAGTAQFQPTGFGRRAVKMGQVMAIGFGFSR